MTYAGHQLAILEKQYYTSAALASSNPFANWSTNKHISEGGKLTREGIAQRMI